MNNKQESNKIRITGQVTGSMKRNIERDLEKGYKQAELLRMAFDVFYSSKRVINSY